MERSLIPMKYNHEVAVLPRLMVKSTHFEARSKSIVSPRWKATCL